MLAGLFLLVVAMAAMEAVMATVVLMGAVGVPPLTVQVQVQDGVVVEVQPGELAIMAPAMFILMGALTILSP
jgi:hypothetical protein